MWMQGSISVALLPLANEFFFGGGGDHHPVMLVNRHMFYCQNEHNTLNTVH